MKDLCQLPSQQSQVYLSTVLLLDHCQTFGKKAKGTAIFRKGSRHSQNNYRPISLTCILCKLLKHIISNHINMFLLIKDLLTFMLFIYGHHSFRSARSCESQLVSIFYDLAHNREKRHMTDVITLDFSKAIYSVNHR